MLGAVVNDSLRERGCGGAWHTDWHTGRHATNYTGRKVASTGRAVMLVDDLCLVPRASTNSCGDHSSSVCEIDIGVDACCCRFFVAAQSSPD